MINFGLVAIALWQLLTFQTSIIDPVEMNIIREFILNLCAGLVIAFLITYVSSLILVIVGFSVEIVYLILIRLFNITVTTLSPLFILLHRILSKSFNIVHDIVEKIHGIKSVVSSPAPLTVKKNSLKDNGFDGTKLPHVLKFSPIFTIEIAPGAKAHIPATAPRLVKKTLAQAITISIYLILFSIQSATIVNASLATQSTRAASVQLFEIVTVFAKSCLRLSCLTFACIIRYVKTTAVQIMTCSQALYHFICAMFTVVPVLPDQKNLETKTTTENAPVVDFDPIPAPVENDKIVKETAAVYEDSDDKFLPAVRISSQFENNSPFRRIYAKPQRVTTKYTPCLFTTSKVPTLKSRHNPSEQAIRAQREQIKELQRKNADQLWDEENWDLHRSLTSLNSELQSARDGLKCAETRNHELTQHVQDLIASHGKSAQSTGLNDEITSPEQQQEEQTNEITALREENAKAKAEVAALKQHNQDVLFNMKSNTEYAALESKNAELKARVGKQVEEYDELYNRYLDRIMGDDETTPSTVPTTTSIPAIATTPTVIDTPAAIAAPTIISPPIIITPTVDVRNETISELKEQIQMLEASLESAPSTDMIAGLQEANINLATELNTLKNKSPPKVQVDTTEIERLQAIIKQHENDTVQHSLNIINVRTELHLAEEKLKILNVTNQDFTTAGQYLELTNDQLRAKLAYNDAELVTVKNELAVKVQDEKDSEVELASMRNEFFQAHEEFMKMKNTVAAQKSIIEQKEAEILDVKSDLEESDNDLRQQNVDFEAEIASLRTKLSTSHEHVIKLQEHAIELREHAAAQDLRFQGALAQQRSTDAADAQAFQTEVKKKYAEYEDELNEYSREVRFLDKCIEDKDESITNLEEKATVLEHENTELKLANGGVEMMKQEHELRFVTFSRQYDELKKSSDQAAAAAKVKFDAAIAQRNSEWQNCLARQAQIDQLHAQLQSNLDQDAVTKIQELEKRLQNEEVQHRITADKAAKDRELRGVAERKVASLEKQLNTA